MHLHLCGISGRHQVLVLLVHYDLWCLHAVHVVRLLPIYWLGVHHVGLRGLASILDVLLGGLTRYIQLFGDHIWLQLLLIDRLRSHILACTLSRADIAGA